MLLEGLVLFEINMVQCIRICHYVLILNCYLTFQNDVVILKEFIDTFVDTYQNLIDLEFEHLIEG